MPTLDGESREARIGRILDDFLTRRAGGEAVSETELLAGHPDLADDLREHLDLLRDLRPPGDQLADLIARGTLTRSEDPRYPAELGAYKITGYIGRGGMGIVLKAYEESLNRAVALKVLRPELADDKAVLTRFEREAKAAAALQHPNIVTVYAVDMERGTPYIAMEYVAGPSLAEVIREPSAISTQLSATVAAGGSPAESDVAAGAPAGRPDHLFTADTAVPHGRGTAVSAVTTHPTDNLHTADTAVPHDLHTADTAVPHDTPTRSHVPTPLIRRIFRELLLGLDAAHKAGLIHRDIKSSNILLDGWERGNVSTWEREESASNAIRSYVPTFPPSHVPTTPIGVKLADFGLARMRGSQTRVTTDGSILGTPEYMSPEQARGDSDIDHRTDLYSAGVVLYEILTGQTPFKCDTPTATLHRILNEMPQSPRLIDKTADPVLAGIALKLMAKRPADRFASAREVIDALDVGKPLPARRRKWLAPIGVTALAIVVLAVGFWGVSHDWPTRVPTATTYAAAARRLDDVTVDPNRPDIVLAWYEGEASSVVFKRPHAGANPRAALVRDLDGEMTQRVVVGTTPAPEDGKSSLAAYDSAGNECWRLAFPCDLPWPDVNETCRFWAATRMIAGNVDGWPGEEIIVAVSHLHEYPTRISIVDPRKAEVTATFWHWGQIRGLLLLEDYFARGHPAIAAWGTNNKLDGFGDPVPSDYEGTRRAGYGTVSAVMILDPRDMDGIGPPTNGDMPLRPCRPSAYAFLDMAADVSAEDPTAVANAGLQGWECATISCVRHNLVARTLQQEPTLRLITSVGVHLIVGRQLRFRECVPLNPLLDEHGDTHLWEARWRSIFPDAELQVDNPLSRAANNSRRIAELIIDGTTHASLKVRYVGDADWHAWYDLGPFGADERIHGAVCVDLPEGGEQLVVVGTRTLSRDGCVWAYDLDGNKRWSADLTPTIQWPDCAASMRFICRDVLCADLDGEPGDEILVVATDWHEYPTRLSILDSRDGRVRSTFWHMGNIDHVRIEPDFFDDGRAAIIAAGVNNKLDGFADGLRDDERRLADWDWVAVAMVLDPRRMGGLGPPSTSRLPNVPPVRPYAYAFLNLPTHFTVRPVDPLRPRAAPEDTASVSNLRIITEQIDGRDMPRIVLDIGRQHEAGHIVGRAVLKFDRDLRLCEVVPSPQEEEGVTMEWWNEHWRPLIRQYERVEPL
ncbi:MAG: serine/threonine protein kinase [Phycisphaerae bacterium]|nr:serine/threonine protein kinase [Phycisphaerae bacterium]